MDKPCHIWMSNFTHMNEWCDIWIFGRHRRVLYWRCAYAWVMSHTKESCHILRCRATDAYLHYVGNSNIEGVHMNGQCHIWRSHVTYERVVSRLNILTTSVRFILHMYIWINLSRVCRSRVIYEGVVSRTNESMSRMQKSCHIWRNRVTCNICTQLASVTLNVRIWTSHVTHIQVFFRELARLAPPGTRSMLHIWMSHVSPLNESCLTSEWVMSHIWMSCCTRMIESCHTHERVLSHVWMSSDEWVVSQIWMRYVSPRNKSCRMGMYEWVVAHRRMNHVTDMNASCHRYEWVMSQIWMSHVSPMHESCHPWMPDRNLLVTRSYARRHAYEWVISHT